MRAAVACPRGELPTEEAVGLRLLPRGRAAEAAARFVELEAAAWTKITVRAIARDIPARPPSISGPRLIGTT